MRVDLPLPNRDPHSGGPKQRPITRDDFARQGISIIDWATERGFSPHLVYSVLSGSRKCLRGQSFRIAKELGMK